MPTSGAVVRGSWGVRCHGTRQMLWQTRTKVAFSHRTFPPSKSGMHKRGSHVSEWNTVELVSQVWGDDRQSEEIILCLYRAVDVLLQIAETFCPHDETESSFTGTHPRSLLGAFLSRVPCGNLLQSVAVFYSTSFLFSTAPTTVTTGSPLMAPTAAARPKQGTVENLHHPKLRSNVASCLFCHVLFVGFADMNRVIPYGRRDGSRKHEYRAASQSQENGWQS